MRDRYERAWAWADRNPGPVVAAFPFVCLALAWGIVGGLYTVLGAAA